MHQIVQISVALVNIVWIIFFSTLDPFLVFIQKRSSSSEKDILMREFCVQPSFDLNWKPTPMQINNTSRTLPARGDTNSSQNEEVNYIDKSPTSATPKMTMNINSLVKPKIKMNPPVKEDLSPKPRRPPNSPKVALTCCFIFSTRMLAKKIIRSYFITSPHCRKTAVLFVTMTGSRICVNPRLLWVQRIIEDLDKETF
ncbi:uncharacterized protein LOC124881189 isoform X1 [Girardinichthys multiradiatus]|uniref:uncharacterized protein LOC124881189 isoform X1 n=2 Tax=Girardinichthys multiradiatus TaxID=208333 RepID=UPI001FAD273B|nr:uncharacterized protein LOC124881189 isoform X1 [Girardinichthys multiradiatus]